MTDRCLVLLENTENLLVMGNSDVFLWDSFEEQQGVISIPKLVEEQVSLLRSEYLEWSASLAIFPFRGSTLSEYLSTDLLAGGSYWWHTLVSDKSPYKTKAIYDVLRARVVEKQFIEGGYKSLHFRGGNKKIAQVLKKWLNRRGLKFTWEHQKSKRESDLSILKKLYGWLPMVAKAFIYLAYLKFYRLWFSKHFKPNPKAKCTIVTYFPGIDLKQAEKGEFYSNYWGPLHNLIKQEKIAVNWVWIYSNMHQLSYRKSIDFQSNLNDSQENGAGRFLFVEDFLEWKQFLKGFVFYFKQAYKSLYLKNVKLGFAFPGSEMNFFLLLKKDWNESFFGDTAMINSMQISSFNKMSKVLPVHTKLVLYVWENQPWEQSLLSSRNILQEAFYVGAVHTPANCAIYNMKVFPGNANEIMPGKTRRQIPDILAVPGNTSRQMLSDGGWPSSHLKTVEALRYISSLKSFSDKPLEQVKGEFNLLVVTGSIYSETKIQLELLSNAEKKGALKKFTKIIIKPHPLISVESLVQKAAFQINHEIVFAPLVELWSKSHIVYTSNSTSVSLEAAYHGIPIIIVGALENLNINPLFGTDHVNFIHSVDELCQKLSLDQTSANPKSDFFELNPNLSIWASIFREHGFPLSRDLGQNIQ